MRRGGFNSAGILGLIAALTGCQTPIGDIGAPAKVAAVAPETYQSPSESGLSASAFPVPPKKPPPPTDAVIEPDALVGIDENAMMKLLGPPAEVGEKPPAIVWTYRDASCTLDLFFYMNLSTQTMRSLTYNFKGTVASEEAKRDCLKRVRARRAASDN